MNRRDLETVERNNRWMEALQTLADEMEAGGECVMAEHIDSLIGEIEFNQQQLTRGPALMERK